MNPGLLGSGGIGHSAGGVPFAAGMAHAETTYAIGTEATFDVTVKQNDGSTTMSVTLTLPTAGLAVVRFAARCTKAGGSGRTQVSIYDNAVRVAPDATLNAIRWISRKSVGDGIQELLFDAVYPVEAGLHVWDARHQAAFDQSTLTWGDRMLSVLVIPAS